MPCENCGITGVMLNSIELMFKKVEKECDPHVIYFLEGSWWKCYCKKCLSDLYERYLAMNREERVRFLCQPRPDPQYVLDAYDLADGH